MPKTTSDVKLPAKLDPGFAERIKPKKIEGGLSNFLIRCKCGSLHFRHAGYIQRFVPYATIDEKSKTKQGMGVEDERVMICVACKTPQAFINGQMYDLSGHIDLEAWEKTEREAHKATGPGGDC